MIKNIEIGDKLIPLRENVSTCTVKNISKSLNRWFITVSYENGYTRPWSMSHIKKYYINETARVRSNFKREKRT